MCGIAGVLAAATAPPPSLEELRRMVAMLVHRGPDGHGLYRDERVGLAHARLSVIDLAGSFQPLHSHDRSIWLSFNGEIFNYVELRQQLTALGHRFQSDGDGEVIVHCYERYGSAAWAMLNGQFSFALWDARRRELWLVRDRMGILPLYYARTDHHVVFASEAKALFAGERIAPKIDPQGLAAAFCNWSVPAPRTLFEGVRAVRPGTALCIDSRLIETEVRYWEADPTRMNLAGLSTADAVDHLDEHLSRSIKFRLRADVPVGSYLSGGLDSSIIASFGKGQGAPLETFGIRFADPRLDETAEQRRVASHLGVRHHEIMCDGPALRDALADVVWHCESPLMRTAPVAMFHLSRLVQSCGIKTVLSGEGADELFAGYTIFKEDQIRRFWARQPNSQRRPALLQRIHHYVGTDDARATGLWRDFFRRGLDDTAHPFYSHLIRWQNTAWTLRLLAPNVRESFALGTITDLIEHNMPVEWRSWDPLTRAQAIEIDSFLSSYLLSSQGDRVAMAHGVEVRYPFLDPDVVDFGLSLPKRHKLLGLRDKLVLRRLAARHLPRDVSHRRKQPFRAPVAPILFGAAAGRQFHDLLPEFLPDDDLLEAGATTRLVAKARRQDGRMGGEREEMALIGVLTTRILQRQFGVEFFGRAKEARRRLERSVPHVLEDRVALSDRSRVPAVA